MFIEENSSSATYDLLATDADLGNNATLTYTIDRSASNIADQTQLMQKFAIDSFTGHFSLLGSLDYEAQSLYTLTLTCSDNGTPDKLTSSVQLIVHVTDVNDNAPRFALNPLLGQLTKLYVNESTLVAGSPIVQLLAIDLDVTPAYRNTIYSIERTLGRLYMDNQLVEMWNALLEHQRTSPLFTVNATSGELSVADALDEPFDFAKINEYVIELSARDSDKPDEFHDRVNVTIILMPANNKLPVFEASSSSSSSPSSIPSPKNISDHDVKQTTSKPKTLKLFRRSLAESEPNTYVVDVVKARDPNQHGIVYSLDRVQPLTTNNTNSSSNTTTTTTPVDTEAEPLFRLDAHSGLLLAIGERSRYTAPAYSLVVRATSTLSPSLFATTEMRVVVDTNDDSLFDARLYTVTLPENAAADTRVFTLRPRKQASRLAYKLNAAFSSPPTLFAEWFRLDDSQPGLVRTSADPLVVVDYERCSEVLLSVDVHDAHTRLFVENVLVRILIGDLNDNAPQFDTTNAVNYEPSMYEDDGSTRGLLPIIEERLVTKLRALDADGTSPNSLVEYSLVSVNTTRGDVNTYFRLEMLNNDSMGYFFLFV